MTDVQTSRFDRFLTAFVITGVILIAATWLITGDHSVGMGLAPFALLWVAQQGQRANAVNSKKKGS
jgi:hypothetical protein